MRGEDERGTTKSMVVRGIEHSLAEAMAAHPTALGDRAAERQVQDSPILEETQRRARRGRRRHARGDLA